MNLVDTFVLWNRYRTPLQIFGGHRWIIPSTREEGDWMGFLSPQKRSAIIPAAEPNEKRMALYLVLPEICP